jgi:glycosyltransferase involved in cell wall biosynthesis
MDRYLVSIITPVFNSERYVRQAIESVQAQTYGDWEIIIVDDCSRDRTCEIIEALAGADGRIRLIKLSRNRGPAISRNIAIGSANGRYIAFLDSDDLWLPDKLEKQIRFMKEHDCVVSYTSYKRIDEGGNIISDAMPILEKVNYEKLLLSNVIGNLTAAYDVGALGKIYLPLNGHEDYGLWLKILRSGYEAWGINECLAMYRVRGKSVSRNKLKAAMFQWKIYREAEKLPLHKCVYYFINYAYHGYRKSKFLIKS